MIEQLFGSKTRVKLLRLFYSNTNRSYYVREITRKIDEQINSVRRELSNLLSIGIITSDTTNNKLYYEVNKKYEYYAPLLAIFGSPQANKKVADVTDSQDEYRQLGKVDLIMFSGQFTRETSIPVDVVVVGNVNKKAVEKYIADLEKDEGKDLRYVILSPEDFTYRRQIKDRFVSQLLQARTQIVVNTNNFLNLGEE